MKNTARAAQKLGVGVVNGFTGSSIWHLIYDFPPTPREMIDQGYALLAKLWNPILDVFQECGIKFGLEVHPTEIAFDIYSSQRALEELNHREEFGFNFDPSHLHLARRRSGRIHSLVPRPDLSRPHEGRCRSRSPAARASSPAIWNSATPVAVGISAAWAAVECGLKKSSVLKTPPSTAARACRSSGKTPAWTAKPVPAPAKRPSSAKTSTSSLRNGRSTRPSRSNPAVHQPTAKISRCGFVPIWQPGGDFFGFFGVKGMTFLGSTPRKAKMAATAKSTAKNSASWSSLRPFAGVAPPSARPSFTAPVKPIVRESAGRGRIGFDAHRIRQTSARPPFFSRFVTTVVNSILLERPDRGKTKSAEVSSKTDAVGR